ncbi:MAG TPA: YciI family protein [Myxococcota bacterium]|nr:YciI family protein [Myxococcota bacterium]
MSVPSLQATRPTSPSAPAGSRRPGARRKAARIQVRNGRPVVTDGPFAETKEVVGGFWIVEGREP